MTRAAAMLATLGAMALAIGSRAAAAAPVVHDVFTEVGEARACMPLATSAGGGALVGTGGGLVRIDDGGAVRAVWTATDGLPGTRIETIAQLGDELWIGTDAGAARVTLAGDSLKVMRALPGRAVRDLLRFDGAIYAATWDGGVVKLGARDGAAATMKFAGNKQTGARARVAALAVADRTLYAGTAAGLYRLAGDHFERLALDGVAPGSAIAALRVDGSRLWIATTNGLYARDADGSVRAYGGGDLRALATIDDALVVAGIGDGLQRVDRGRLVAFAGAPRELAIAESIGTRDGALCAGGLDGVWLRGSSTAAWIHAAHRDGPPSNDISALAADGDRLWVGTFDHGLAVREHGTWRTISHPELDARVNELLVEARPGAAARIWVATANGLSAIDGTDVSRLVHQDGLPGRGVISLSKLRDGRILVGTSSGAVIVGGAHPERVGPDGIPLGTVWATGEDPDGALWLGATTGLYRGHVGDAVWARYSLATGHLRDDWVTALVIHDRTLFVGTYNGGVTRLELGAPDSTGASTVTATQLGDGWVNPGGLTLDGNVLYAATMDGLRAGDGTTATWTAIAGLPGKDVTTSVRIGATLWVATRRGLAELR